MKEKGKLVEKDGELIYFKGDKRVHAGLIKIDGAYYYIGHHGHAVKGEHVVHKEMANGLLPHGTYTFGEDYKLIRNSYKKPARRSAARRVPAHRSRIFNWDVLFPIVCAAGVVILLIIFATIADHYIGRVA